MDVGPCTASEVVPVIPAKVADMVVVPMETAEAVPPALMVATPSGDELHLTSDDKFRLVLLDRVAVAVNCCVMPTAMVGFTGVIAMAVTVAEVRVVEPVIPLKVALMVVEPVATAVAVPAGVIVAHPGFDELQLTRLVKSWLTLLDKTPVALNCWMVPTMLVGSTGVSVMDASADGVNVVEPEIFPDVAVIVVVPGATAVVSPFVPEELLMVATPLFDEPHVTEVVRSWAVLSEKNPVALNCKFVPGTILLLAG